MRVCYLYFEEYAVVFLVVAFAKNEKGDLIPGELKAVRHLVKRIEMELAQRVTK